MSLKNAESPDIFMLVNIEISCSAELSMKILL